MKYELMGQVTLQFTKVIEAESMDKARSIADSWEDEPLNSGLNNPDYYEKVVDVYCYGIKEVQ